MTTLERVRSGPEDGARGLSPRRMHEYFERSVDRTPDAVAVEVAERPLTYRELDERANALAHLLRDRGVRTGSRVAILLPRSLATYESLLAVGKAGGAFVPIDPDSPADRVAYIADDADVDLVLTTAALAGGVREQGRVVLEVDAVGEELARRPRTRPAIGADAVTAADDPAAYVIYTSGSSGRPKGVEVAQSSIVNFLDVVPEVTTCARPTGCTRA